MHTLPHDSYGVRDIVEKWCWNLLYNVERLRKDHLEVEVFARFLEVTVGNSNNRTNPIAASASHHHHLTLL